MSETEDRPQSGEYETEADDAQAALADLPDGSGCAEIWAHLSERRRRD